METAYNYKVVRQFAIMTVVWGVVGMLVGVLIAAQLLWPELNFDVPWLSYGRLRPLHTNAVIFAFGGCALFATSYYVVQRTCQARLFCDRLAAFTFWGWQAVIVLAADHAAAGHHLGKEYAELEWPIDILIAAGLGRLRGRVLRHARRSARSRTSTSPTGSSAPSSSPWRCCTSSTAPRCRSRSGSRTRPTPACRTRWCSGGTATTRSASSSPPGFLGMMYYFIPKQAGRPIYSYRLSVVHFWALIFTYMWAGPHHLHYTALPDWTQSLGMVFSLILLAPSWGGMINGIMTLSGAWHKLRTDPILKFLIVSLSFYGMSTFEGPMMSIKTVNALSHYTDWTIGHVHARRARLGGLHHHGLALLPDPAPVRPHRDAQRAARSNLHFWIATIGIVLYIAAMWIAGVMQGLMWRAVNDDGTLTYTFVESVKATYPFYAIRLLGGVLYLAGMLIMAWNVLDDGARRASRPTRRSRRLRMRTPERTEHMKLTHDLIEKQPGAADRARDRWWSASAAWSRSCRCSSSSSTTEPVAGLKPYARAASSPGATSTCARAATTATRR